MWHIKVFVNTVLKTTQDEILPFSPQTPKETTGTNIDTPLPNINLKQRYDRTVVNRDFVGFSNNHFCTLLDF